MGFTKVLNFGSGKYFGGEGVSRGEDLLETIRTGLD